MWDSREMLLAGGIQVAEWRLRRKGGTYVPVEVSAKILPDGRWQGFVRDITERKRLEEALRRSEVQFRTLFEAGPDALVVSDAEGRILAVNAEVGRLLGYTPEELMGQSVEALVPAALRTGHLESRRTYLNGPARRQMSLGRVVHALRKDGVEIPVEIGLSPFDTPSGPRVIAAMRDVTDRIRAHEELQRQAARLEAANRELEAFGHAVAHDLRGPLRALSGYSEILLSDLGDSIDEDDRHLLVRMQEGAQRMAEMLDALQRLTRISAAPLRREHVDLAALVREAADELREEEPERRVDLRVPAHLDAEGDAGLLRLLVENLLRNAWKFSASRPVAQVEIGAVERDGERTYFVRDDGVGFDAGRARALFLPFRRLHDPGHFPGTGVGLATVDRVVRRHGGRVWAESRPGEGATFYFTLPPSRSTAHRDLDSR